MSNVIARYRKTSKMEVFRNITDLRDDMMKFLLREKNVPKKYRAVCAYPIINAFEELITMMKEANSVRTPTPEKLAERKSKQLDCIHKLDEIYWLMQRTVGLLWKDKLRSKNHTAEQERLRNALNDFALRMNREEELLRGWRNGSKLMVKSETANEEETAENTEE